MSTPILDYNADCLDYTDLRARLRYFIPTFSFIAMTALPLCYVYVCEKTEGSGY